MRCPFCDLEKIILPANSGLLTDINIDDLKSKFNIIIGE